MPGIDGDELVALLQEDPPTRHISLMLASADFGSKDQASVCPSGVMACLAKPYDEEMLLACIARFSGRK